MHRQPPSSPLFPYTTLFRSMRAIAEIVLDDGLEFDAEHATAERIREEEVYGGVRVSLTGELSAAKVAMHIDVNVGDRSEEHTSELQSHVNLVCRLLLEKKKN